MAPAVNAAFSYNESSSLPSSAPRGSPSGAPEVPIQWHLLETLTDFIFWGPKINADSDCSHKVKTLAPWKESYDKPRQHIKKQKTALWRQRSIQSKLWFSQQSCMDVSWTIKKAKCHRNDALELWCWRRLLRVPWTARRSNQSILKEINPEYSLEGLMLKLKLQSFVHLMQRADSLEKTLMLGKRVREGGNRG